MGEVDEHQVRKQTVGRDKLTNSQWIGERCSADCWERQVSVELASERWLTLDPKQLNPCIHPLPLYDWWASRARHCASTSRRRRVAMDFRAGLLGQASTILRYLHRSPQGLSHRNEESELQCSKEGQALFMEDELTTWLGFFPDMGDELASVPAESTMTTAAGTTVAPPPGSSGRGTVSEAAETSGMGKVTEGRGAAAAHGDDRKKLKGKEEHHHHHNDDKTQSEVEWYESGGEESKRLNKSMWRNQRQSRAAADVHNLSERRRRDRINEKMKVLQQLVPRCNKLDKASMLDDVVEYIKSLQLLLQIMYRTYAMYPVVFPGIQLHAQPTEIGMPMGIDTKRELIGNPMLPFPSAIHGYPMLGQPAAHLSTSLSMQTVCPAPVSALEPGPQTSIQQDLAPSFSYTGGPYPGITLHDPNLLNCYHRYLPLHYLEQPDQDLHMERKIDLGHE